MISNQDNVEESDSRSRCSRSGAPSTLHYPHCRMKGLRREMGRRSYIERPNCILSMLRPFKRIDRMERLCDASRIRWRGLYTIFAGRVHDFRIRRNEPRKDQLRCDAYYPAHVHPYVCDHGFVQDTERIRRLCVEICAHPTLRTSLCVRRP